MFDPMDEIARLPRFGAGVGLARLEGHFADLWQALRASGVRVVHVVGSNGKGSTATFLEALLRRTGLRTGLFTSPHLHDFAERIRLDGACVDNATLAEAWRFYRERAGNNPDFGSFEAITVMAAHIFARAGLDVLVAEAGIGGRFDPTRMFAGDLAVLTSIDLEHKALLGNSIEEIAADKMDVGAPGGVVISGWLGDRLSAFCNAYAGLSGKRFIDASLPLTISYEDYAANARIRVDGRPIIGDDVTIEYRVPAEYLVRNSVLALRAAERILPATADLHRHFLAICADFSVVGRFERIGSEPAIFCDMAHTPAAVREVVDCCRKLFGDVKPVFVLGMSADKDWGEMCRILAGQGARFLLFRPAHKGQDPEALASAVRAAGGSADIEIFGDAEAAAEAVRRRFAGTDLPIVATGGMFSAIEFRTAMMGKDVASLRFY